jgi:O-antigen/teichoic acid export membrane protein
LLVVVVGAASLRYVSDIVQVGMIAARRFWWLVVQYGSVALAAVIACTTLIPSHGLDGAALSLLAITSVQLGVIVAGVVCHLPRRQAGLA